MNMKFFLTLIFIFPLMVNAADKDAKGQEKKLTPMELRLEMHRRMMERLLHGDGPDEGLFDDLEKMMQESFSEAFKGFQDVGPQAPVKTTWQESKKGRTLRIDPSDPDLKLDIKIENAQILIKGEKQRKGGEKVAFSEFSYSLSTPHDVDASAVEISQEGNSIMVFLPFKKMDDKGRTPLPKRPGEVTI